MGCDIHLAVELWRNGRWTNTPRPDTLEMPFEDLLDPEDWWWVRSYCLFGVLAGVRSQHVTPIAEPRGFPADADPVSVDEDKWNVRAHPQYGEYHPNVASGDHTPSWLLLSEVYAYPHWGEEAGYGDGSTVRECCSSFMEHMQRLAAWAKQEHGCDLTQVRLVFNFDN